MANDLLLAGGDRWVDTDMGWDAAKKAYGLEQPPKDAVLDPSALKPLTVQESVDAMLEQVYIQALCSLALGLGYC